MSVGDDERVVAIESIGEGAVVDDGSGDDGSGDDGSGGASNSEAPPSNTAENGSTPPDGNGQSE